MKAVLLWALLTFAFWIRAGPIPTWQKSLKPTTTSAIAITPRRQGNQPRKGCHENKLEVNLNCYVYTLPLKGRGNLGPFVVSVIFI